MLINSLKRAVPKIRITPLISSVRHKAAYEGEGKTTIRVINPETDLGLMIDTYGPHGFRLNNGITVLGPMVIFPRTVLSWQVTHSDEITEGSLALFNMLEPKVDLIILGIETKERRAVDRIFRMTKERRLNVEILPTEHACSTFNFLNAEGRSVAAALIPPAVVQMNEDDMLKSRLHYDNLYKNRT